MDKGLKKRVEQLNTDNLKLSGSADELNKVVLALQGAMGEKNVTKTAEESLKIFVEWLKEEAAGVATKQASLKEQFDEVRNLLGL